MTNPMEPIVESNPPPQFENVAGVIFSCLGCVIGTGNLWRFPRIVARNSGDEGAAAFFLMWFISLFLWSIPLLAIEYALGRYSRVSLMRSFYYFFGKCGIFFGGWVTFINFFIGAYYMVILSWCLYYIIYPMMHPLPTTEEESFKIFQDFSESKWPFIPYVICLFITAGSVMFGVKGIEKVNLVLVPLLLIILLCNFFYSFSLQYSEYGLDFLFNADWSTLTHPSLYLDSISQNAFDTAAGGGLITTYAIYLSDTSSIMRYTLFIPLLNNGVSLIASLTIFPTVFGILLQKYPTITRTEIVSILKSGGVAGTGLTFIWIPILMSTMNVFGRIMCSVFFLCLSFAGISSIISTVELLCICLIEFGLKRNVSIILVSLSIFTMGIASILDLRFLANQDAVWGYSLIISGLLYMALVWKYGPCQFRKKIVNDRKFKRDFNLPFIWIIIITIITPIEALTLIIWWIYSEISENQKTWYIPSWQSLIIVWIEWFMFAILLLILNIVFVKLRWNWTKPNESTKPQQLDILNENMDPEEVYSPYEPRNSINTEIGEENPFNKINDGFENDDLENEDFETDNRKSTYF